MKRILAVMLALLLCFGLCACGQNGNPTTTEPEVQDPTANVPSVLLPFLDALYGKWTLVNAEDAENNPYATLEVRKDGTCVADGVEYTWKFDDYNSNDTNLFIKIYQASEHICGAQVSGSPDSSVFFFRAMDVPFIFCPGVWEKSE